ncbi:MAG: DUF1580 domain-containing protein [Planctomycetaceae bacterium]|nr:DUF1580 domain-containing protein [Planctomycetaceae bacterium]
MHRGCLAADGTRVRLESYRAGGRTMTTIEAVERFIAALTAGRDVDPATTDPVGRSTATTKRLIEAGLLPRDAAEGQG